MKFIASLAIVAASAFAQDAAAPLGVTQVSITWDNDAVSEWAQDYDAQYAVIGEAWAQLWTETVAEDQANKEQQWEELKALLGPNAVDYTWKQWVESSDAQNSETWGEFARGASDLIQQEQALNERKGREALDFIGDSVVIDGEKLADLCPWTGDQDVTAGWALSNKNIATMIAQSGKGPHVTCEASTDLAQVKARLEESLARLDKALQEITPEQVEQWEQSLKEWAESMAEGRQAPTTMKTECYWDYYYNDYVCYDYTTDWERFVQGVEETVEAVAEAALATPLGQYVQEIAPAYAELDEAKRAAEEDQWYSDAAVADAWVQESVAEVTAYFEQMGAAYETIQSEYEAAVQAQWEQDSEGFQQALDETLALLEEQVAQLEAEIEAAVQEKVEELKQKIEEAKGAQVYVRTAKTQSSNYGFGAGVAAGLVLAGVAAVVLRKKDEKTVDQSYTATTDALMI